MFVSISLVPIYLCSSVHIDSLFSAVFFSDVVCCFIHLQEEDAVPDTVVPDSVIVPDSVNSNTGIPNTVLQNSVAQVLSPFHSQFQVFACFVCIYSIPCVMGGGGGLSESSCLSVHLFGVCLDGY